MNCLDIFHCIFKVCSDACSDSQRKNGGSSGQKLLLLPLNLKLKSCFVFYRGHGIQLLIWYAFILGDIIEHTWLWPLQMERKAVDLLGS